MLKYIFKNLTGLPANRDTSLQRCHLRMFRSLSPSFNCTETGASYFKNFSTRSHSFPRSHDGQWQFQYKQWLDSFENHQDNDTLIPIIHVRRYHKKILKPQNCPKSFQSQKRDVEDQGEAKQNVKEEQKYRDPAKAFKLQYTSSQYELDAARPRREQESFKQFNVKDNNEIRRGDPTGHLQPRNIKPFGSTDSYYFPAPSSMNVQRSFEVEKSDKEPTPKSSKESGSTSKKLARIQCRGYATNSRSHHALPFQKTNQKMFGKNFSMSLEENKRTKSFPSHTYNQSQKNMKLPKSKSLENILKPLRHTQKSMLGVNTPYQLGHAVSAEKIKKKSIPKEIVTKTKTTSLESQSPKENLKPVQLNMIMAKYMKKDPRVTKGPTILQKILQKTDCEKRLTSKKIVNTNIRFDNSKNSDFGGDKNLEFRVGSDTEVPPKCTETGNQNASSSVGDVTSTLRISKEEYSSNVKISGQKDLIREISKKSVTIKPSILGNWGSLHMPKQNVVLNRLDKNSEYIDETDSKAKMDNYKPRVFDLNDPKSSSGDFLNKNNESLLNSIHPESINASSKPKPTNNYEQFKSTVDIKTQHLKNVAGTYINLDGSNKTKSKLAYSETLADKIKAQRRKPDIKERITFNLRPAVYTPEAKPTIVTSVPPEHDTKDVESINEEPTALVAEIVPMEEEGCLPPLAVVEVCDISDSPVNHLNMLESQKLLTGPDNSKLVDENPKSDSIVTTESEVEKYKNAQKEEDIPDMIQFQKRYYTKPKTGLSDKLNRGGLMFSRRNFSTNSVRNNKEVWPPPIVEDILESMRMFTDLKPNSGNKVTKNENQRKYVQLKEYTNENNNNWPSNSNSPCIFEKVKQYNEEFEATKEDTYPTKKLKVTESTTKSLLKRLQTLEKQLEGPKKNRAKLHNHLKNQKTKAYVLKNDYLSDPNELSNLAARLMLIDTGYKNDLISKKSTSSCTSILKNSMSRPSGDWIGDKEVVTPVKKVRFSDVVDYLPKSKSAKSVDWSCTPNVENNNISSETPAAVLEGKEIKIHKKVFKNKRGRENSREGFNAEEIKVARNQHQSSNLMKSKTCHDLRIISPRVAEKSKSKKSSTKETKERKFYSETSRSRPTTALVNGRTANVAPRSTPGLSMGMLLHPPLKMKKQIQNSSLISTRNFSSGLIQTHSPFKKVVLKKNPTNIRKAQSRSKETFLGKQNLTKLPKSSHKTIMKREAPLKSFRECLTPELKEALAEHPLQVENIQYMQPSYQRPVFCQPTVPQVSNVDYSKEEKCVKSKLNIKNVGTTRICGVEQQSKRYTIKDLNQISNDESKSTKHCAKDETKSVRRLNTDAVKAEICSTKTNESKKPRGLAATTTNVLNTSNKDDSTNMLNRKYHMLSQLQERNLTERKYSKTLDLKNKLRDEVTSIENMRNAQWRINNFYKWQKLNNTSNIQITLKRFYSCMNLSSQKPLSRSNHTFAKVKYLPNNLNSSVKENADYILACNNAIKKVNKTNLKKKLNFISETGNKNTGLQQKYLSVPKAETTYLKELSYPNSLKCIKANEYLNKEYKTRDSEMELKKEDSTSEDVPKAKEDVPKEKEDVPKEKEDFFPQQMKGKGRRAELNLDFLEGNEREIFFPEKKETEYQFKTNDNQTDDYQTNDDISKNSANSNEDKPDSIWQRIVNYFKARPNCPPPGEWRRQAAREKAEKYAKLAGLIVCEKDRLLKSRSLNNEGLPKVITYTPKKKKFACDEQKRDMHTKRLLQSNKYKSDLHRRHFSTANDENSVKLPTKLYGKKIHGTNIIVITSSTEQMIKNSIHEKHSNKKTFVNNFSTQQSRTFSTSTVNRCTLNEDDDDNDEEQVDVNNDSGSLDSVSTYSRAEAFEEAVGVSKKLDFDVESVTSQDSDVSEVSVDLDLEKQLAPTDQEKSVKSSVGIIQPDKSVNLMAKRCYSKEGTDKNLKEINRTLDEKDNLQIAEKIIRSLMKASSKYPEDLESGSCSQTDSCDSLSESPKFVPRRMTLSEIMFGDPKDEFGKFCQAKCLAVFLDIFRKTEVLSDINYEDIEKKKTNKLVNELNKLLIEETHEQQK